MLVPVHRAREICGVVLRSLQDKSSGENIETDGLLETMQDLFEIEADQHRNIIMVIENSSQNNFVKPKPGPEEEQDDKDQDPIDRTAQDRSTNQRSAGNKPLKPFKGQS